MQFLYMLVALLVVALLGGRLLLRERLQAFKDGLTLHGPTPAFG